MAAFLNIPPTRVKIVSIVPGSVKINMAISEEAPDEDEKKEEEGGKDVAPTKQVGLDLSKMAEKLKEAAKTGELAKSTGFKVAEMEAEVHDTKD